MNHRKKILFLCVANSARSQIAEALTEFYFNQNFESKSAGSRPSGIINPNAIECLSELNISTKSLFSKAISDVPKEFIEQLDFVITLCEEEECPYIHSNAKNLHWPIPDPKNKNDFKQTIHLITEKLKSLNDL